MSAKERRLEELLDKGSDEMTDAELDEFCQLIGVDVEEEMSRLYLDCLEMLNKDPNNPRARSFVEQREQKLRERNAQRQMPITDVPA